MDLTIAIRQRYESQLRQLAQFACNLNRARGKQKKQIEQQFNHQVNAFLSRVRNDFPSRPIQNSVLAMLYLESGLTNTSVANALRAEWQRSVVQQQTRDALAEQNKTWNVGDLLDMSARPAPDMSILPFGSWFLQFDFKLAKPYISHDDTPSYIIDNPVSTDRVFGMPMIRPSSWKGNLRSAVRQSKNWPDAQPEMVRLFGNPKGAGDDFRAGRLECYPTFFYRVGLEIINPHDRTRKVGKNPILFECVPAGATGTFSLLYVPFDLIGKDETETCRQAAADLLLVVEGLQAMFLTYGFSAKRTSGYGVAKETVNDGFFQIRIEEPSTPPAPALPSAEPQLPKYLQAPGKLKDEYLTPEGTFRERTQAELAKMSKPQKQEYEKAQKWWEREGKALAQQPPVPAEPPPAPAPQWLRREFNSFQQLCGQANQVAQTLQTRGDA